MELIALFSFLVLLYIAVHLRRIRELMEGPTDRCRYCLRRYSTKADAATNAEDRTCYRRGCRKQYWHYTKALDKAESAVRERWEAEHPGSELSQADSERRYAELLAAAQEVDERYGGESGARKKEG